MRKVEKNTVYKHFKGNYYIVIDIAYDASNDSKPGKKVVIYKSLSNNVTYVRSLDEFASKVDHEKYPDVKQIHRFERVNMNKLFKTILDNKNIEDEEI